MMRHIKRLGGDKRAAVAPTVALSLFALIGAAGIAFDYARMASLDTELQNAADQAALAAATQLDGQAGACARAAAAAAGLLSNETVFANEAAARTITVANESACDDDGSIRFYQSYDQTNDTFGPEATTDAEARIVAVQVDPREAVFALTPIVGAFRSGDLRAEAVAALGSAICKVPPVMMCNPAEPEDNTDVNLDFSPGEGVGIRLVIGSPDAPGNFGFLRTGEDGGAKEVAKTLGYDNPPNGCVSTTGVETEPGNMISVRAAFNTRFDISESGAMTCPESGQCSSSPNSRKDLVRNNQCGLSTNTGSNDWHEALDPYRPNDPENPLPVDASADPEIMGYPRDICHAVSEDGACSDVIIGDGKWDIDAFFRVNYGLDRATWMTTTGLAATNDDVAGVSRYDVYKWELDNPSYLQSQGVSGGYSGHAAPVCRSAASTGLPDRRKISVAVVNCEAQNLNGHEVNVQVQKWLDVFLVEPAVARGSGSDKRTGNGDIYVEAISVTSSGGSETAQVIRRDVPYLIR